MANFPGAGNAVPQVVAEVITETRAVSVPGGVRTAAIMGEGVRTEVLVSSAVGGGNDGLNPTWTSTTGSDGRHFALSTVPVIVNRTTLFRDGIPLVLLDTAGTFTSAYDAQLDITTGHITLQAAALDGYVAGSLNVGNGQLNSVILVDVNAPTETWTVRCSSVRRDSSGPMGGYAKFVVRGTVSGIILDGYGNQITWQSNGTTTSNTILQFSITEGAAKFVEGDYFTINVQGGTLTKGESLTATYICEADLNDPVFFSSLTDLTVKHGSPSLTNRLSLGAQMAFANSTPGVWAVGCAPSVPRRISHTLIASASGGTAYADLSFALPLGVMPDVNSNINLFITNPTTEVETQILPNKVGFHNKTITDTPTAFAGDYVFSYTVVLQGGVEKVLFTTDLALGAGYKLRATIVDTKDASFFDAGWQAAYDSLTKIDVDMVVPLPSQTISAIFGDGKAHVIAQSGIKNKHERILMIGAIQGLTPDNLIGNKPAAVEDIGILEGIQGDTVQEILVGNIEDLANYSVPDAFGDTFRVVYFWPDQVVVQIGADRVYVDGFFVAASAAGWFSGVGYVATPLTKKTLSGFTILRNKLLAPITMENLAAAGVTILQPVIGGGEVVWGKTTTQSGFPEEEEISIVFIRDRIAKTLRTGFAGFIGTAETPTFQSTLFARADGLMKSFVSSRLITAYKNLSVVRDSVTPTQWNIVVAVQPVYPVNFIYIKVGIGTL